MTVGTTFSSFKQTVRQKIKMFDAGYFAFVMATGIVSITASMLQMERIAAILFYLNLIAYAGLLFLTILRVFYFLPDMVKDIGGFERGPAVFTVVAGTCIVGSQFVILSSDYKSGLILCILGSALWLVLIYAFFAGAMTREFKVYPPRFLDGGSMIYAVGTQSLSLLGALVASGFPSYREFFIFFAVMMYFLGAALYFVLIILIFYRLLFLPLPAQKLTPSYWINMGAGAITTLSGSTLIMSSTLWIPLESILPFLRGLTLFFWAVTTWWIPLLAVLNVWRHRCKQIPIGYDVQYWSMVFPLGMYSACTFQVGAVMGLTPLYWLSAGFFFAAFGIWCATLLGLLCRLWAGYTKKGRC